MTPDDTTPAVSMPYEDKLAVAMEALGWSPEDFGELLAIATGPIDLDNPRSQATRAACRRRILELPYGREILDHETPEGYGD